jgi:glycosyltransferase involved in cell wall biosynthesis
MKILFTLNDEFDPNAGGMGVTSGLLGAYRERGHDVACFSFADLPSALPFRGKSLFFPEFVAANLWRSRADVIDSAVGDGWLLAAAARRRRGSRPLLVARSHGLIHFADRARREEARRGGLELSWKYPLYWGGFRVWEATQALRLADLCLFLNDQEHEYAIAELGISPDRARIVDNGIPDVLRGLPLEDPPPSPFRVVHIGSYLELKGVRYVARAMDSFLRRHPQAGITYLGTGCPPEQILADYSEELWPQIEVRPKYGRDQLPELLRGHSLVVTATLKEGFPLGTLEAMACGLAAISAATPGPLQYVRDGENGLVVPQADGAAIEAALERLIADPGLLYGLRQGAQETAQRYGWDRIADETLALYAEALGRLG